MHLTKLAIAMFGVICVAACDSGSLREISSASDGPDEFIVVPNRPLDKPEQYSELPPPTPDMPNRAALRPIDDAVIALGGRNPVSGSGADVPRVDVALVTYARRSGVVPDIRIQLANADADFRKRKGRFSGIQLTPQDRYNSIYKSQAIDPIRISNDMRARGITVPSAPPQLAH